MPRQARIETDRLLLRPFESGDAPVLQRELSRIETARMVAVPHPYPADGATSFIENALAGCEFAIVLRETAEVVGGISIHENGVHRRAELGYWCALDHRGRGYATEAARAVVAYGFRDLELNRVYAECHADNPASRRVLQKSGLTLEGRLRRHSYRIDRFADKLVFGVLREEWLLLQ